MIKIVKTTSKKNTQESFEVVLFTVNTLSDKNLFTFLKQYPPLDTKYDKGSVLYLEY